MNAAARIQVEDALKRISELVQTLATGTDTTARSSARELLQKTLDLHGLALAKIAAKLSATKEGCDIYTELGRDEQVKAVLLLHGLHPESPDDRIKLAMAELESALPGTAICLLAISDGIARVRVEPGPHNWDELCREIGRALIDAAPDLDDIAIERPPAAEPAVAAE